MMGVQRNNASHPPNKDESFFFFSQSKQLRPTTSFDFEIRNINNINNDNIKYGCCFL